ncbi:MAG: 23S rRNA (adenine(2503)-C(2))-methyltransferase RlmN [Coriobacteriales bacterium]|nr:23S rRNA (adenine(2503)-C(2))-methyltransferase RlmN [Coriobacteriales bacterium]
MLFWTDPYHKLGAELTNAKQTTAKGTPEDTANAKQTTAKSVLGTAAKSVPEVIGIKRYGIEELQDLVTSYGQPAYRAEQLIEWLYCRWVSEYSEMSNLPKALRDALSSEHPLTKPEVVERQVSTDGTRKYLLKLADETFVETVGIPENQRLTVCFSTQVGCGMGCSFCATGHLGLIRQLSPGEMVDQLLVVAADFDLRVSNAVAMGEGEPFANYTATMAALRLMNHSKGLNIGARHLTVSTSGIIPGIKSLAKEPEQFRLAVSLHSARQVTRDVLMPGLAVYRLPALRQSLLDYCQDSGRRVTLEYTLIEGINDSEAEIKALIKFTEGINCHINLICLNPTEQVDLEVFKPPSSRQAQTICVQLQAAGIETTLRRSRGVDINSACGQLAGSSL